jgi:UDP-N-acetylmuramoyl-L-alanyl-D-glutamate--2,6-diaminopimelate ligase
MDIINDIKEGVDLDKIDYTVDPDRAEAITRALKEARTGDIVLVAGKGHETYQIFKNITLPFDDRKIIEKILTPIQGSTLPVRGS